jgi:hypothetical protein
MGKKIDPIYLGHDSWNIENKGQNHKPSQCSTSGKTTQREIGK